jgi:CHASE2 domain-containing sensor protein
MKNILKFLSIYITFLSSCFAGNISKDIVIISVTDKTISTIGTFPWTRDKYAKLINATYSHYKPSVFFNSFMHDLPSKEFPKGDKELALSIIGKKNLLLCGTMGGKQKSPLPHFSSHIIEVEKNLIVPTSIGGIFPMESLTKNGGTMALSSKIPQENEYYNTLPSLFKVSDKYYTSVSVIASCKYLGINYKELKFKKNKIQFKNKAIKTDENCFFEVDFNGKFNEYDYLEILNKKVPVRNLKNKIIIFSSKATGWTTTFPTKKSLRLNDIYLTAYGIQTIINTLR